MKPIYRYATSIGFLSFFLVIFFSAVFFGSSTFISDGQFGAYQQKFSLWSTSWAGGWPVLADTPSMTAYPIRLILVALGIPFHFFIYFGYLICAIGTLFYLRCIGCNNVSANMGALSFTLSGWMLSHLGHTSMIHASIWFPWVIFSAEMIVCKVAQRCIWSMVLSIFIALSLLAGHLQISLYILIVLVAYLIYQGISRKSLSILKFGLVSIVIGIALCSFVLIPTLELSRHTFRSELTHKAIFEYSFPLNQAFDLLIPFLHGGSDLSTLKIKYFGKWNLSETTGYLPHIAVITSAVGVLSWVGKNRRLAWFWCGVAIYSFLLAIGDWFPLGAWVTYSTPMLNKFRAPSRHLLEFSFAISVISAMGASALLEKWVEPNIAKIRIFISFSIYTAIIIITGIYYPLITEKALAIGLRLPKFLCYSAILWSIVSVTLSCLTIWFFFIVNFEKFRYFNKIRGFVLLFTLVTQVSIYGYQLQWHTNALSKSYLEEPAWALKYRFLVGIDYRVLGIDGYENPVFDPDLSRINQVPTLGWYGPLVNKSISQVTGVTSGGWTRRESFAPDNVSMDIFSVKYVAVQDKDRALFDAQPERWRELDQREKNAIIYENRAVIPRTWVVSHVQQLERDKILQAIATSRLPNGKIFDPSKTVLTDSSIPSIDNVSNGSLTRIFRDDGSHLIIDVWANSPGILVIGDAFYPGWKAWVNGTETKVNQVNYALRGIAVPQGISRVELLFRPQSFIWGVVLSIIALATLIVIFLKTFINCFVNYSVFK
jgi:Bacterial membrane protein YfhO/6-pyruvoyl-tetrahydropterin synthase related domain